MILNVNIAKRVATYTPSDEKPVCGNSGDQVKFTFDEEWDGHDAKTARFIWNGQYHDVEFTGDTCEMPIITMASAFSVGVYVGEEAEGEDVLSSTKAVIAITPSIRCETKRAGAGTGANYTNEAKGAAVRSEAAAVRSEAAAEAAEAAAELAGEAGGGDTSKLESRITAVEERIDGEIVSELGAKLTSIYLYNFRAKPDSDRYWGEFSFYTAHNYSDITTASGFQSVSNALNNGVIVNKLMRDMSGAGDVMSITRVFYEDGDLQCEYTNTYTETPSRSPFTTYDSDIGTHFICTVTEV